VRARGRFHEHNQDALDDDLVRYATRSTPLEISKGLIWTRARDGSPTTPAMPLLETRQERAALLILILAVTVAIGLGPFVSGLLGAAVLYVVLVRPYSRLERLSKAGIAAPVVLITALLLIALPAAWLVSSLIDQAPDALQRIQASDPLARLGRVRIGNSPSSVLSHHPPMPNAIIRLRQARTPRSIVLAATTVVLTRVATAQSGQHPVGAFLARTVVLTPAETTSLARGDAVARILRTGESQDVAVFAVVRINVSRSFFMDAQRDLPRALRSPMRTQVHLFSEPATVADVQALTMSDDDVKELRKCRPNECNFKLPATDMERLKRTIDLSAPDATANAATYARQRMVHAIGLDVGSPSVLFAPREAGAVSQPHRGCGRLDVSARCRGRAQVDDRSGAATADEHRRSRRWIPLLRCRIAQRDGSLGGSRLPSQLAAPLFDRRAQST